MSIIICIGKYGGFYIRNGYGKGVCLGWLSITVYPVDIEASLEGLLEKETV